MSFCDVICYCNLDFRDVSNVAQNYTAEIIRLMRFSNLVNRKGGTARIAHIVKLKYCIALQMVNTEYPGLE